ncbi:hypothetical protein [Pelistega suis]|uniref:hypothetical protein n=1 Tax=Pelistega suis TaxID=1631957 RepID=UPI00211C6AAB|nr:hypothetical protein [Pelistega suis]MCQ9328025.1 hypothetical protein [Pelistega suis]
MELEVWFNRERRLLELCSILVAAGMDPDGTSQDQLLQALRATFFDNRTGAPILYVQTTPSNKIADIIYVIDRACFMRWQTIGSWTGYASDGVMDLVICTTVDPKPNEIDLIGGTCSKSAYPALWAKVQANNLVIAASAWTKKIFRFVDLGGDNFKLPDLRDTFIRATGFDVDSANVRQLGSYQADAIRNITGSHRVSSDRDNDYVTGVYSRTTVTSTGGSSSYSVLIDGSKMGNEVIVFDASAVVPTSTENRTENTAFHLRLNKC